MIHVEEMRDVHVLRMSNGPANVLAVATGMVADLGTALVRARADPECRGVVIAGANGPFCGGADLADLDRSDELRALFEAIEWCAIPVVMAISGSALGGGVELALAGHRRIALRTAQLALPEVGLGLLPGLGGTQRLPRLIGADRALDLMLSGNPITAEAALAAGLIDAVVDGDVVEAAIRCVRNGQARLRRTCQLAPPADAVSAAAARRPAIRPGLNRAPDGILDCVARMSCDFAAGMDLEAKWLDELVTSEASRALRHVFFAQRAATRIPGLDGGPRIRPPATAYVLGRGPFSQQVAASMRASGVAVSLGDRGPDSGSPELVVMGDEARVGPVPTAAGPGAITAWPRRFARLPAEQSPRVGENQVQFHCAARGSLMEVIRRVGTAPVALGAVVALGKAMGRTVVVSGDRDGSIYERLAESYAGAIRSLLLTGTPFDRIDHALACWGMAQGPVAAGHVRCFEGGTSLGPAARASPASADEIVELCLLNLINEGAHLVQDEVAWRPVDVDVAAVGGLGFPPERGGPMFQADLVGLSAILPRLRSLHADGGLAREPATLLETLVAAGETLTGWHAASGAGPGTRADPDRHLSSAV